ncbi:hypothetical protein G7Z17_g3883 [Cylindrodendrum hubeiense]|uniref:Major facilitator superfamily (MFS) profile domain-containing protein n=1 Tax=Cylindrodendrum hubeiense TaxID=595255 RepID=A0A9P5LAE4_9HYPO|nr:hypothetical protein G7Z17_g3883 [Cylindrodendrum hubeiense]
MEKEKRIEEAPSSDTDSKSTRDSEPPVTDASSFELKGLALALVMTGLSLAIFLMSLDSSIIATAVPRITSEFNSTGDIGWYGSAYSFAMSALQPMAGKLFTTVPMKELFIACLAVFEVGSLLCALATNSPMLIVGRAIA